jgi:polar amino acid transport system ATP-binding protein
LPFLEIANVCAGYAGKPVLEGVSFAIERGEVASLIGPSGSGKSTLLRTIIGLLPPTSGRVSLGGQPIDYRSARALRAARDRCAIVFQQYNLFGNMTALGNVTIGPVKVKRWPRGECEREARLLLEKVGLGDKLHSYPDQLSGGQQQRVALARALALRPDVLLLDEVTSALDPELVGEVLDSVRMLARDGMTMVIVSHEMGFVREVSTKVVFMADGRTVEEGTPDRIFTDPVTPRARDFIAKIIRH